MDLHPIFVHFPIALLTLYALAELLPLKLTQKIHGFHLIKQAFLYIGVLSSSVTLYTGLQAGEKLEGTIIHELADTHELFAIISVSIFSFIMLSYLFSYFTREQSQVLIQRYHVVKLFPIFRKIFAVIGLITITITGTLGGIIVYGPDIDPVAQFIYSLFFS